MPHEIFIYNTLTRKKEKFEPLVPGHVGLYVCGPTVYGDPHLGHARPGVVYDVFVRLLKDLGYKVRYVRNITDVGHMESDADEGEDKIAKKPAWNNWSPWKLYNITPSGITRPWNSSIPFRHLSSPELPAI